MQYHIVCGTKYRHPVLTGAVDVETKTILAQTCTEYGWTLKAIEVMPEHVHLFLEVSAPSSIARTLKSISAVHIFTSFPKLKERKFWDPDYGPGDAITGVSVQSQRKAWKST